MKVTILGGGPAGLYCALLLKKADPGREVVVVERNAPDATYGWGVVFSDRTLASFQEADYKTYRAIRDSFVQWDAIDIFYGGERVRCGGHVFAGLARKQLLAILQRRCAELGVSLRYNREIAEPEALVTAVGHAAEAVGTRGTEVPAHDVGGGLKSAEDGRPPDAPMEAAVHEMVDNGRPPDAPTQEASEGGLLIAADGVNSLTRAAYAEVFRPSLVPGSAKYIWLGSDKLLDAFTFLFRENEHGLFQVHSYPFDGTTSTFIVECAEETWRRAGLDTASEAESIAYCERLFAEELRGARLYSNNSRWISFVTVKTATWRHGNVVLLGDAAHTAHFSIGSGTKLAMEDAIALANALDAHGDDLGAALREYEAVRRPVVESLQEAARESQSYFEHVSRYAGLVPAEFAFNLLTRSGRITYDDLRLRDARFGEVVDRHFESERGAESAAIAAGAPLLAAVNIGRIEIASRVVSALVAPPESQAGVVSVEYQQELRRRALAGAGLVLTAPVAVHTEGRITSGCAGMYREKHLGAWSTAVRMVTQAGAARMGIVLNHAGRRGAVRTAREARGLDRPLREGAWPLVAASAIPYAPRSQTPQSLERAGMERVRDDFARAARMANEAGFDLLMLHMAHGYLLAGFLSPLANVREDEYGGNLENRMQFPLEVFDAVRAVWPAEKPLGVALNCDDCAPGGFTLDDAVVVARALKARGCDLISPLAGQTVPDDAMRYGRGFLTAYSERIRNEVGIATLVGGYLTTSNEVNTVLAGGRADLCVLTPAYAPARVAR